jgi:CrcB protein
VASARWFSATTLLVVVLGGALGVAARALVTLPLQVVDHPLVVPTATLVVNLLGSFLLGMVVGALGDRRARLRAFLGTGVLGGFTTYSAFAVQTVTTSTAAPVVGLLLIAFTLFGGVVAAVAGLGAGRRLPGGAPALPSPESA